MIPGIDVSHWQNEIDWAEVKRSGVRFAFIKATEFPDKRTTLFVDNKLKINSEGAQANGIHWSAYHFFRTHIDPILQAKVYCETVGDFSSLPPVMDLEVAGSKGERLNYKVRQFLEEVEKITNRKPILYTSSGFWRSYMMSEKREHTDWARFYPLWLAHYTALWPSTPYPWIGWSFWQHSDHGTLPGIKTHVDLNWYTGSEEEMIDQFVISAPSMTESENSGQKPFSKPSPEAKNYLDMNSRGDYQEESQVPGFTPVQLNRITTPEAKYSNQEENWIRTYFFKN